MNDMQIKYLIRKKLIKNHYSASALEEVCLLNPDSENKIAEDQLDSATDFYDN